MPFHCELNPGCLWCFLEKDSLGLTETGRFSLCSRDREFPLNLVALKTEVGAEGCQMRALVRKGRGNGRLSCALFS